MDTRQRGVSRLPERRLYEGSLKISIAAFLSKAGKCVCLSIALMPKKATGCVPCLYGEINSAEILFSVHRNWFRIFPFSPNGSKIELTAKKLQLCKGLSCSSHTLSWFHTGSRGEPGILQHGLELLTWAIPYLLCWVTHRAQNFLFHLLL